MGSGAADREAVEQQGRRDGVAIDEGAIDQVRVQLGRDREHWANVHYDWRQVAVRGLAAVNRVDQVALLKKVKGVGDADRADVHPDVGRPSTFLKEPRLRAVMWDFSRKGETPGRANLNCISQGKATPTCECF